MAGNTNSRPRSRTRRAVLGSMGAACTFTLAGCIGDDDDGEQAEEDDSIRIGISIPQSGDRSEEGEQLLDGYELAIQHITEGTGPITESPWGDISNDGGILGRDIVTVIEDTNSTQEGAQAAAEQLADEVDMFTGGGSLEEGLGHQAVASEEEVIYMGGFTPGNNLGGDACSRYAFNEMYNPEIAGKSLAAPVGSELGAGSQIDFIQLYSDNQFGDSFSRAIESHFDAIGPEWGMIRRDSTRPGQRSYTSEVESVLGTGPDLVILNIYGLDGVNALRDLEDLADEDITVVVPLLGPEIVTGAGSALEDVFGTVHWLPGLPNTFSSNFEDAWDDERSTDHPTQFAHLAYVQLCQWAAAVERAGTTETDAVIGQLEGHQYNVGGGEELLRACDHQAMRYAPVVKGHGAGRQSPGNYYELAATIPDGATNEPYSCNDTPAWSCDF